MHFVVQASMQYGQFWVIATVRAISDFSRSVSFPAPVAAP